MNPGKRILWSVWGWPHVILFAVLSGLAKKDSALADFLLGFAFLGGVGIQYGIIVGPIYLLFFPEYRTRELKRGVIIHAVLFGIVVVLTIALLLFVEPQNEM